MESERLRRAILDPSDVYDSPSEVLSDSELTKAQKIEVLRRWEYDASEISVAEDEGMPARNGELLSQIMRALDELGVKIDSGRRPPTRQGGLDQASVRREDPDT